MPANNPLVGLFKVVSREDPVKMARCKEAIQDLLDLGTLPNKRYLENVSIGENSSGIWRTGRFRELDIPGFCSAHKGACYEVSRM